ncbi:MAG: hypothetical protein WAL34_04020 [Acidobacteriaceae bacterium]
MLWLVKNGMPWHVALGVDPDEDIGFTDNERLAAAIIFGKFEGGDWSWASMSWSRKDA